MKALPMSLFLLPHLGLIRLHGMDARNFLQAQLSSDVRQISAARAQLAGYCSAKGRLLAVATVMQLADDAFVLVLPAALLATTLKRLKMFVLRSKLVLDEASDWQVCGSLGAALPNEPWQQAQQGDCWQLYRPGSRQHQLVLAPAGMAVAADAAQEAAWRLAELDAGLPIVHPETLDHFVPQTADLDLAGGISFSKGCYPGQEIVARVHYLGRLKQRLFLADCADATSPGADVLDAGTGAAAGEVMDCLPSPDGGHRLSLVLNLAAADGRPLRPGTAQGAPLAGLAPAHVLTSV